MRYRRKYCQICWIFKNLFSPPCINASDMVEFNRLDLFGSGVGLWIQYLQKDAGSIRGEARSWKVFCKSRNAWQMMMSCCCWHSFFTGRTRRNYWRNCWNMRSRKPLSLLRAQLYTTQRLVHCVLRRLLAGGLWFFAVMVCSKSYRGRYASPALATASYPFVDLSSGDTLRCKLFPADKFHKICYLFDRQ